jgi:ABC-type Fe3+ transport system substrate-binding protein
VTLSNKAPHPNVGKAFGDFFLGRASMATLAKQGRQNSIRRNERSRPQGFAQKKTQFQQIFLR